MHISLDSALGRQRRLNSVGESVFQIAPNAAAGYSLRSLTGGDPAVVRVRRESDNAERDFNASGVSSGELVNWVNQQITPPLDLRELTATGRDGPIIDAAAAYSLRNLSDSYTGNVVDVRRSSDDAEDSFTAAEVADGTMVAWVNTDVDKLDLQAGSLDAFITNETATGFDFSVNNVGSNKFKNLLSAADTTAGTYTATLDVVLNSGSLTGCNLFHESSGSAVVTPLTEGANSISLTPDANTSLFFYILGTAVADVSITNITLTQTSADGTVSQWYDQSGNDNHATQGTDASQPKIVSAGSLLNEIKFDGADDVLNFTEIDFSTNSWMLSAVVDWDGSVSPIVGGSTTQWSLQVATSDNFSSRATNDSTIHNFDPTSSIATGDGLFTVQRSSDVLSGYYDGVFDDAAPAITAASEFKADKIGQRGSLYGSSGVKEIIIYETDQSDKRIAIEENIGSNYGITVTSSKDGTVSTWYDQSTTAGTPNANHAVQTSAASQPKIVDGGLLVAGGLDFDGTNDGLFTASTFTDTLQSATIFALTQDDTTSGTASMVRLRPNGVIGSLDGLVWEKTSGVTYGANTLLEGSNGAVTAAVSGQGTRTTSKNLNTLIYQQSQILAYENGGLDETLNNVSTGSVPVGDVTLVDQLWLGQNFDDNARPFNGTMQEVIIYFTDQSDNRTALEANIGEVYGIAGIPAYEDTVNGFVESWYDQSGNGNDATQLTAGSQPKIVDAGVLVSDGIEFDGVDGHFDFSSGNPITSIDAASAFFVGSSDSSSAQCGINLSQSASQRFYLPIMNSGNFRFGYADSLTAVTFASSNTSEYLFTGIAGASTTSGYYDGELKGTVSSGTGVSGSGEIGSIGSIYRWDGRMREIIIYDSDQSANREAIEANINNQYDIY